MRAKTTIELFDEARRRNTVTITPKSIVQADRPKLAKLLKRDTVTAYVLDGKKEGKRYTKGLKLLLVDGNNLHIVEDWPSVKADAKTGIEAQAEDFKEIVVKIDSTIAFRIALGLYTSDEVGTIEHGTNTDSNTSKTKHPGGRPRKYGINETREIMERRARGETFKAISNAMKMSTRTIQQLLKRGIN